MGNKSAKTTTTTTTTIATPVATTTIKAAPPRNVVAPAPAPMGKMINLGLTDLDDMYDESKPLPKVSNTVIDLDDDDDDDDDNVPSAPTQNIPSVPPPPYTLEPTNTNATNNNDTNNKATNNNVTTNNITNNNATNNTTNNNANNKNKRNKVDDDDEIEYTGMKFLPPSEKPVFKPINVVDDEAPEEISRDWEEVDLMDPVTMERMSDPVRGDNCKHKAVFDRKIYEEFKKQNPEAACPICKAKINRLLPNKLFQDILRDVKADKIRIYPDNRYEPVN